MRLSRYFLPVLKENPAEAQIVSHRLMLRAGMIKQSAAGIYSWLPLGLKVLKNIENIIHEEQEKAGHLAILMPTIQVKPWSTRVAMIMVVACTSPRYTLHQLILTYLLLPVRQLVMLASTRRIFLMVSLFTTWV